MNKSINTIKTVKSFVLMYVCKQDVWVSHFFLRKFMIFFDARRSKVFRKIKSVSG